VSAASDRAPVSVIIPYYNGQAFIRRSIDSVQSQQLRPLEIIVVEDGSPVALDEAALHAAYSAAPVPVHVVRHEMNRGIPAARNTGVRAAAGEYVAFLDQDDEWLPNKLSSQWELVERERAAADHLVFYGRALRSLSDGSWIAWPRPSLMRHLDGKSASTLPRLIVDGNPIPFITLLFSKRAWEQVGGFDEDVRGGSDDYALLLKFAAHGIELRGVRGGAIAKRHETGENYSNARRFLKDDVAFLERLARDFPGARAPLKHGIAAAHYRAGRWLLEENVEEGRSLLRAALRTWPVMPRAWLALATAYLPASIRRVALGSAWNAARRLRAGRVRLNDGIAITS
jgi:glycosyltransferase involved in cell wall biosynthesis